MGVIAHLIGMPVEEAALSLVPFATVLGGIALAQLRGGIRRREAGR